MNAFLTGSRVYGTPREDSDVDLVVNVSMEAIQVLSSLASWEKEEEQQEEEEESSYGDGTANLRFGNLNLICIEDPELFEAWREGTNELIALKPVTRDEAVRLLTLKRRAVHECRDDARLDVVTGLIALQEWDSLEELSLNPPGPGAT